MIRMLLLLGGMLGQHRLFKRHHSFEHLPEAAATEVSIDLAHAPIKHEPLSSAVSFDDPLWPKQWHLFNRKLPGHDVNVLPVWREGITGKGVVVCIIDDGIDFSHPDLEGKFRADLSHDFNAKTAVPIPDPALDDRHGTRCAGQIVSIPNNGRCGVGVAHGAEVSAIRILSGKISTGDEAAAVIHRNDANAIYSCSWGPADDGQALDGPASPVLAAFIRGLQEGRGGLGSVYVFAAGNGKSVDNCNYDGYANGIFSLTVGAIDMRHQMPIYMEPCAAQLAVTYSSSAEEKICTTDLGGSRCTCKHGGTSAAAPLAAGLLALVLEANPRLSWRDVQHLVVATAQPFSLGDHSWVKNGADRLFSLKFGFGKLDAARMVQAARSWQPVGSHLICPLPSRQSSLLIPLGRTDGLTDTLHLDPSHAKFYPELAQFASLEQATVTLHVRHPHRGRLQIFLRSPSGTLSQLATRRPHDDSGEGLRGWTMSTVAFWGEEEIYGDWQLQIVDTVTRLDNSENEEYEENAELVEWRLTLWGVAKPGIAPASDYAERFHNVYYPPNPDYHFDHHGMYTAKLANPPKRGKTVWLAMFLFAMTLLIVLMRRPLLALFHRLHRRTQVAPSYEPVSIGRRNFMSV